MAQNLPSAEYRALVNCTYRLVVGIAIDPQIVAVKLYARNLIARIPPDSGQKEETANELVRQVTNQVMLFPQKLEEFLAVLREIPALTDLAQLVKDELEKIKMETLAQIQSESSTLPVTVSAPLLTTASISSPETLPSNVSSPPSLQSSDAPSDRFPYLNSNTMTQRERKKLIAQLEADSEKMMDRFAILVDRVRVSLERQNITSNDLVELIRNSHKKNLIPLIEMCKNIKELFKKFSDIWTFFDYELLRLIIKRYCLELMAVLTNYESELKKYCGQRICQLPNGIFDRRIDAHVLYVKIDRNFTTSTLEDIQKLEYRLSELLALDIYLLRVEEGCILLVFICFGDILTPLTLEQNKQLKEMRVMRIYDDNTKYFNNPDTTHVQKICSDDIVDPFKDTQNTVTVLKTCEEKVPSQTATMPSGMSAEYRAFINTTDKLIDGISTDPSLVGNKLFTRNLITHHTQRSFGRDEEMARELIKQVNTQVAHFPQKYEQFMTILREMPSLQDLAKLLEEECEKIKMEDKKALMTQSEKQNRFSLQPEDNIEYARFPYLKSYGISEKEKEKLIARLVTESNKMKRRFAFLVEKVSESLERKNVACRDLTVLIQHSMPRLICLIEKHTNISDLFSELNGYWTFFDYEFLTLIIQCRCPELMSELTKYTSTFKEYCKRRICKLPADVFASKGDKNNLYMKIDCNFATTTLEDVKELERKISNLLDTKICLLKVEEGCVKLTFNSLCDISTPLTPKQTETLKELKVMRLYSDTVEYFNSTSTTECNSFPHQSALLNIKELEERKIQHSMPRLICLIEKHTNISDLFSELNRYWTFFDYEFLTLIIQCRCPELMSELTKYTSTFKEYCKRRLFELPADVFASKGDKNNLYMKIDHNFATTTLEDVKELECKISNLLDTEICLLKVKEGCVKLTFNSLRDISTPLTPKQTETLKELKVMRLYSDTVEYFNSTSTTECNSFPHQSALLNIKELEERKIEMGKACLSSSSFRLMTFHSSE